MPYFFVYCSSPQEQENRQFKLQTLDSISFKNPDSVLFMPGYVYAKQNRFYYLNVSSPYTTHLYNQQGAFEGYILGNEDEEDNLPFNANLLVPEADSLQYFTGAIMHFLTYNRIGNQLESGCVRYIRYAFFLKIPH